MKKLFLFLAMASTTMFVSCGSDDNGGGTPAATSITLTASATTIDLGQPVTLTVKDNNGADVTARATFFDGTTAITSPYTPTTTGAHSLTAKYDNLTSASVVVTVNAVAEANSIFVDGENAAVTNSILVFFGGYAEVEGGDVTHGLFSMITFDDETGEVIYDTTTANNYIDVEFIVPLDAEGQLQFPTAANSEFLDIYEVWVSGTEVTLSSQEGGSLTLEDFPDAINMPHSFSATADYNGDSSLEVNFDGNWLGFLDATAEARSASANKFVKKDKIKTLSRAELAKVKANFFANLKK